MSDEDYIVVAKDIKDGHWFILEVDMYDKDCTFKTKLVHKKHEDILNAYLEDSNVTIEFYYNFGSYWIDVKIVSKDFMDGYCERSKYRIGSKK